MMASDHDGGTSAGTEAFRKAYTRKDFLRLSAATVGAGALMGAAVAGPATIMALAPAVSGGPSRRASIGKVDDYKEGEWTKATILFEEGPEAYVSEKVCFVRRNAKGYVSKFTGQAEEFTIISNTCAHLGCPVQQSGEGFVCPCHGGSYDGEGRRVAGPPPRPLDRWDYEVKDGELWVYDLHSLTNDGKQVPLHGPGQATSGLQGLLFKLQP